MMKRLLLLVTSCMAGPGPVLYPDDPRLHSDKYGSRHHENDSGLSNLIRWYESDKGYPTTKICNILRNDSLSISKFFNARKEEDELVSSFLNTRLIGDEYENICDEETLFIYPKKGTNKKGM